MQVSQNPESMTFLEIVRLLFDKGANGLKKFSGRNVDLGELLNTCLNKLRNDFDQEHDFAHNFVTILPVQTKHRNLDDYYQFELHLMGDLEKRHEIKDLMRYMQGETPSSIPVTYGIRPLDDASQYGIQGDGIPLVEAAFEAKNFWVFTGIGDPPQEFMDEGNVKQWLQEDVSNWDVFAVIHSINPDVYF